MNKNDWTIATLGSHSSLQILKGAKDEGFKTLLVVSADRVVFYQRFPFIDNFLVVDRYQSFPDTEKKVPENTILIPHGSFVAYLGITGNQKITIPYFGNKAVLTWEADRKLQQKWLHAAKLTLPAEYASISEAIFPIIVKTFGAAGGAGYFLALDQKSFNQKVKLLTVPYILQRYVVGVTCYFHYFYSSLTKQLELLSIDRRYETNADGLGRLPNESSIDPSFVVVGNEPLVVRESLLPEVYAMGEQVVAASQQLINSKGLYGPFCLETVITPDQKIHCMEISCRIVAGTNLFISGSPYADLLYSEPMSTGRRIAREIKLAITKDRLKELLD